MKRFSLLGTLKTIVLSSGFLLLSATVSFAVDTEGMPQAPVPGELTMVDLGAKGSIKVTKNLFVLLVDSLRTKGLVGRGYLNDGFKIFTSNKPLKVPGDTAGLRFRIQPSDVLESNLQKYR